MQAIKNSIIDYTVCNRNLKTKKMHEKDLRDCVKRNGEYYSEGLKWHNVMYHYPFVERSWLAVISSLLVFCIFIVCLNIYYVLPIKTRLPFTYYAQDIYEEIPRIQSLFNLYQGDKDTQTVVEKYLINHYVSLWHQSPDRRLQSDFIYVKRHSSRKIYNDFLKVKNISQERKSFFVEKIDITKSKGTTVKKAEITIIDKEDKKMSKLILSFRASDVLLAYKKIVPLDFIVTDYEEF